MKDDDLNESNKVNEDMISSPNIHVTNKSKFVKQLKTVRKKSLRNSKAISNGNETKNNSEDKRIIMEFISDLSLLGDNNDNPYLKAQNKACQDIFLWIPLFKEVELIRNTNFFNDNGRLIPWFEVRKFTIIGANWGLFSLQKFTRDDVMGRYLGYKVKQGKGKGVYTVTNDNRSFTMDCSPYPQEFDGHGVHLANDPNWNRDDEICKKYHLIVNASVKTDVVLTCDAEILKIDDEIFYSYNYIEE